MGTGTDLVWRSYREGKTHAREPPAPIFASHLHPHVFSISYPLPLQISVVRIEGVLSGTSPRPTAWPVWRERGEGRWASACASYEAIHAVILMGYDDCKFKKWLGTESGRLKGSSGAQPRWRFDDVVNQTFLQSRILLIASEIPYLISLSLLVLQKKSLIHWESAPSLSPPPTQLLFFMIDKLCITYCWSIHSSDGSRTYLTGSSKVKWEAVPNVREGQKGLTIPKYRYWAVLRSGQFFVLFGGHRTASCSRSRLTALPSSRLSK